VAGQQDRQHEETPTAPEEEPNGEQSAGQVSEAESLQGEPEPISPGDATAGYPESESGHPDEGPAGPDAPARKPRHDPPHQPTPGARDTR